jgi:hypothetical protein
MGLNKMFRPEWKQIPYKEFKKKYNFKDWVEDYLNCKLDDCEPEVYDWDICDNCLYHTVRHSTGCSWCGFMIHPVGLSICDLYKKDTRTNRILYYLCYWHWEGWLNKQFPE